MIFQIIFIFYFYAASLCVSAEARLPKLLQSIPKMNFSMNAIQIARNVTADREDKCGISNSPINEVYEGYANIETYPWLGALVFPMSGELTTSPVILITRQLVIGAAVEIASLPKKDFRARSKVILGHNCTGPTIKVLDYTYHPDFQKTTFSSLVLIQLDILVLGQELRPICPPPNKVYKPEFYAMSLSRDCMESRINIYKMTYVDTKECKQFYRRSGLDEKSVWPKYTVCAKALRGGECLWQSGVFLVMKQDNRWMLAGFGVHGPGCESPARFLDYGMYHQWVRTVIERIGRPAITRLAPNVIIMRRRLTNVQRFGPCDAEETRAEIYTDHTAILPFSPKARTAYLNFTILSTYEYSCIVFRCNQNTNAVPTIHLRRLCLASRPACYQFSTLQIDFDIVIVYFDNVEYHVNVYGEEIKFLDSKRINVYANRNLRPPPINETYRVGWHTGWG